MRARNAQRPEDQPDRAAPLLEAQLRFGKPLPRFEQVGKACALGQGHLQVAGTIT